MNARIGVESRRKRAVVLMAVIVFAIIGIVAGARAVLGENQPYQLAADMPRGALVYAQCVDLPSLVKRWDESSFKQAYLASANFEAFKNRHLALKLVARWQEFNNAVGFELTADMLGAATDAPAAIGLYDIGRLDFVFIAPLDAAKSAATQFFVKRAEFEEVKWSDDTVYYRREIKTDRGRQTQQFVFAFAHGRFCLATSETLLRRTLSLITAGVKSKNDSLAAESDFKALSHEVEPHTVAVWVNQAKLNRDSYFRHYWLMSEAEDLANVRAGMFSLEMQNEKWVEHRAFIAPERATRNGVSQLTPSEVARLTSLLPADVAAYQLRAIDPGEVNEAASAVRDALCEPPQDTNERRERRSWSDADGFDASDADDMGGESYAYYAYLDDDYDLQIDDKHDAGIEDEPEHLRALEDETMGRLRETLRAVRPRSLAIIRDAEVEAGLPFAEFKRAAILTLAAPYAFNGDALEAVIAQMATSALMTAGATANLSWRDEANEGSDARVRTLELPMLNRRVSYAIYGSELICANDPALVRLMLRQFSTSAKAGREKMSREVDTHAQGLSAMRELSVVRLDAKRRVFDPVFTRLEENSVDASGGASRFFTEEIGGLLDAASSVKEVGVVKRAHGKFLYEDVSFIFK